MVVRWSGGQVVRWKGIRISPLQRYFTKTATSSTHRFFPDFSFVKGKHFFWSTPPCLHLSRLTELLTRTLAELQKLDGVPVIRGDKEEEEEAAADSDDASDLDEELYNDPDTQEIIRNLVL